MSKSSPGSDSGRPADEPSVDALRAMLAVNPDGEPIAHPRVIESGSWQAPSGEGWTRLGTERLPVKKVDRAIGGGLPLLHIVGTRETLLAGGDAARAFWTSVRPYYVYDGAQPTRSQSEFAAAEFKLKDRRMIILQEYL